MSDEISHYRSWKDARERMDPKQFARELLTEENYLRYLKSCEFTTKGLFIGFLAGFLVPVIVLFIMTGDVSIAALFGVSFGVIWMLIWGLFWLIVCRIAPQGKIQREFGKWYKDPGATIGELDVIFYNDNTTLTAPEFDISSVGSHELSEKEKKRVRRYGLFLPLFMPFMLMTFPIAGVWLLLEFINGFVFHYILSDLDLTLLLLAIEIIYMIAFSICSLGPHFGMNGVKWGKIALKANVSAYKKDYSAQQSAVFGARAVGSLLGRSDDARAQRAGQAANALAAVGAAGIVAGVTNDNLREVRLVADACGVKLPETKKYVRFIVIFPILLLIAAYVPQFISAKQAMDTAVAMASESVYALQSAFEDGCDSVSIFYDPQERYNDNGYYVTGRIYHDFYESVRSEDEAYIHVTVDNDGLIAEVDYCAYIDIQADKEENLAMIKSDFYELNRMLNASGVEAVSNVLMDTCELPEEFVTRFQENSYYEYFSVDEGESITVSYITDTEEDYDEYSDSYVYLSIKSDN